MLTYWYFNIKLGNIMIRLHYIVTKYLNHSCLMEFNTGHRFTPKCNTSDKVRVNNMVLTFPNSQI